MRQTLYPRAALSVTAQVIHGCYILTQDSRKPTRTPRRVQISNADLW